MEINRILAILLFELFGMLFTGCNANSPDLKMKIWNDAKAEMNNGDRIWYSFNVSHSNQSKNRAADPKIMWYLPSFLEFEEVTSDFQNVTASTMKNSSNIELKFPDIFLGKSITGNMKVKLDSNGLYGSWQHNIVVITQLIWYDKKVQNATRKEYNLPLMTHSSIVTIPGCVKALGMRDGRIKDHQISAKISDPALGPNQARPNRDAWCAKTNELGHFIQIVFRKKVRVSKILTWGRNRKAQWVTKYTIHHSQDNVIWLPYKENGFEKILTGAAGPSAASLLYPFKANSIRIFPVAWKERICLRFELFGCEIGFEDNCVDPIGIESGRVPNEAFQDSIPATVDGVTINPTNARLNKLVTNFPFGWMARANKEDWLQIDFGSVFKITNIAIQGSGYTPESLFFVKTYKILHSKNAKTWNKVTVDGKEKIFVGPSTAAEAKDPFLAMLAKPIYGRYFRVIPLEFLASKVMRIEMYGCVSDGQKVLKRQIDADLDLHLNRRSVLLDRFEDFFYACFRQSLGNEANLSQAKTSCLRSKTGKTWEELNPLVRRIIGLDEEENVVYGMDDHLSYLSSRQNGEWAHISPSLWKRISRKRTFHNATSVSDILVTKIPSASYQWTSHKGVVWGVSGDGIHRRQNELSTWQLVAIWKCCGQ